MKTKHLFQILVLLAVLFSTTGFSQPAFAQEADPVVVIRELTYWDATYTGNVDANRFEKWPFVFNESHDFTVTVTPTSGDLAPWLILMDVDGNEMTSGPGFVSSSQPAGSYFVQVQPESGSGSYTLMIREATPIEEPEARTTLSADTALVGESVTVTVSLNNVPAEGYASAEFTCTYPFDVVEVSNIVATDLFGADPAVAIHDPANGSFIVAIAGSNGQKATTSGAVFTFTATGLQVGQADINCVARVSKGEDGLTQLPSTGATLTIQDNVPPPASDGTLAGQVFASKAVTVELYDAGNAMVATTTADSEGLFSLTVQAGTYTAVAKASGFLNAQGSAEIVVDQTTTKSTISLVAGDIDGNGVIDQFDAMTIGMSYNTADPEAADLNNDGVINVLDLEILAANYRASGALNWE